MCELGDPDCRWEPGLPEGEYSICQEHWVRLSVQMLSGRPQPEEHRARMRENVLLGVLAVLIVAAMVVALLE